MGRKALLRGVGLGAMFLTWALAGDRVWKAGTLVGDSKNTAVEPGQLVVLASDFAYVVQPGVDKKWAQRALAGAVGGMAGWSNTAGRTSTPVAPPTPVVNGTHECPGAIVGAPVRYSQDKATLYLIGADNKTCRMQIIRQIPVPATTP
jgi:hypothetical protein